MKYFSTLLIIVSLLTHSTAIAQSLPDCSTNGPMFIAAEQPAVFTGSLQKYFENEFGGLVKGSTGGVQLQILIDTSGNACCMNLSNNKSGISDAKIKTIIASMPAWKPARQNNHSVIFSALVQVTFRKKSFSVIYINENPPAQTRVK